jgi:hypothetical protein
MTELETSQTAVNDPRTQAPSDTNVTQPRSGFDPVDARRNLIAKRVAAGADTEIGHRCSNLVELLDNYAKVESEEQRAHIEAGIRKQMADLAIRHQ